MSTMDTYYRVTRVVWILCIGYHERSWYLILEILSARSGSKQGYLNPRARGLQSACDRSRALVVFVDEATPCRVKR
jgi:hypothetical protein